MNAEQSRDSIGLSNRQAVSEKKPVDKEVESKLTENLEKLMENMSKESKLTDKLVTQYNEFVAHTNYLLSLGPSYTGDFIIYEAAFRRELDEGLNKKVNLAQEFEDLAIERRKLQESTQA